MTFERLETERLVIEPLAIADNLFILELVNTEGWLNFIGDRKVHTPEDAEKYIQRILSNPNFSYLVFKRKDDRKSIGIVTFLSRDDMDHPDIGFAMLPAYAGQGFAYEASKKVVQAIIESGGYQKILAITLPHNHSSIQLLEKLGLQLTGEKEKEGERLLVYSMDISHTSIHH